MKLAVWFLGLSATAFLVFFCVVVRFELMVQQVAAGSGLAKSLLEISTKEHPWVVGTQAALLAVALSFVAMAVAHRASRKPGLQAPA